MTLFVHALPWRRYPKRIAIFGLALALALALFVPTLSGYIGVRQLQAADAEATAVEMSDDSRTLVIDVELANPTARSLEVRHAELYARVKKTLVTEPAGNELTRTEIEPGETMTIPVTVDVKSDHRELASQGFTEGTIMVSGKLRVRIGDTHMYVDVSPGETDG